MPDPRPIFLLTDFGVQSYYPGVMQAVILGRLPSATVVNLCHGIAPGDVREAGFVLEASLPWLPAAAIVVAVVDPGVGTDRAILMVTTRGRTVVAPDNGLLTGILAGEAIAGGAQVLAASQDRVALPDRSRTFHGRDVFAPLAAGLARGMAPDALGHPITTPPLTVTGWMPSVEPGAVIGHVIHVDSFGNLVTDIRKTDLPRADLPSGSDAEIVVDLGERRLVGLVPTFGAVETGALLAYVGSAGHVEVAVRDGRADVTLGLGRGDPVRVVLASS